MKLIKIACPNCNAQLKMEDGQKSFKCEYCGTNILLDDEVIKVDHVIHDNEKDEEIKKADALIKFEEYEKAAEAYSKLMNKYSYDPEMYYKFILCETKDFTDDPFEYINIYSPSIVIKTYEDQNNDILDAFEKYSVLETDKSLLKKRKEKINKYIDDLNTKYDKVKEQMEEQRMKDRIMWFKVFLFFVGILFLIGIIVRIDISKNEKEVERIKNIENSIKCRAYCNNSEDSYEELTSVTKNNSLYCHMVITDGEEDYEYSVGYRYYYDGSSGNKTAKPFSDLYKKDTSGMVYWTVTDNNPLKTGKFHIEIYNTRNLKNICETEILITE